VTTVADVALTRRLRLVPPPADGPFVSFIVPARDEERAIERSVRSLLSQDYPRFEVIVVNDRSTDGTGEILARVAAEDSRLVVLQGKEPPPGWLGKPWALHEGSRKAKGELLLFVDADLHYASPVLSGVVADIEAANVEMLALLPHFEMQGFWEQVAMPMLAAMAFMFMPLWLSNRSRIVLLAIGGGTGNLVRRTAYDAAGGHESLKGAVVDDVGLARLIRRQGGRTQVVRTDPLVTLRMYHGLGEIVEGFTKNAFTTMGRSYSLAAGGVVVMLVAHVLPYLITIAAFVRLLEGGTVTITEWLCMAIVALITASRLVLFTVLRYSVWSALFLHPVMMLLWIWIFLRSMWITGIRNQVHWRGRKYERHTTT
jgi:chlorobactene glucosyltransferase